MIARAGYLRTVAIAGCAIALLGPQGCRSDEDIPTSSPWSINDYSPEAEDGITILVLHDMEGLSGQDDPRSFDFGNEEYPVGQELLAGDINAVVDGLFAGGATEVYVVDGHGSGNPDPDLRADLLDERAVQVLRGEPFDTYFDLVEPGAYDAVAVVGMHAKTGSGGFASHTYTLGIDMLINGRSITETELVALSWGRVDVPVIFASGDDRLAADLETMPWIEFVTVKHATSASTAMLRPVDEARSDLRAGAMRAVQHLGSAKVMNVSVPIRAGIHAVPPASLRVLDEFPGLDYADDTVWFVTNDLRDAYDGMSGIIRVATVAYLGVLRESLRQRDDADALFAAYNEALLRRWFDQESGRYERPPPGSRAAERDRQYHGYQ